MQKCKLKCNRNCNNLMMQIRLAKKMQRWDRQSSRCKKNAIGTGDCKKKRSNHQIAKKMRCDRQSAKKKQCDRQSVKKTMEWAKCKKNAM